MSRTRSNCPPSKCKVFLVDDHPIVRQGLALFIEREPDLTVCVEAEDANSTLQAIQESTPDFVILDISLNGRDGLDLLKTLRIRHPGLAVLCYRCTTNPCMPSGRCAREQTATS